MLVSLIFVLFEVLNGLNDGLCYVWRFFIDDCLLLVCLWLVDLMVYESIVFQNFTSFSTGNYYSVRSIRMGGMLSVMIVE